LPKYRWFCQDGIVYVEAVPAINAPDLMRYGDLYLAVGTQDIFIDEISEIEVMDYEEFQQEIEEG